MVCGIRKKQKYKPRLGEARRVRTICAPASGLRLRTCSSELRVEPAGRSNLALGQALYTGQPRALAVQAALGLGRSGRLRMHQAGPFRTAIVRVALTHASLLRAETLTSRLHLALQSQFDLRIRQREVHDLHVCRHVTIRAVRGAGRRSLRGPRDQLTQLSRPHLLEA